MSFAASLHLEAQKSAWLRSSFRSKWKCCSPSRAMSTCRIASLPKNPVTWALEDTGSGLDAMPVSVKWIALHSLAQSRPNCCKRHATMIVMVPKFSRGDFLAARLWSSPYLYIINYSTSGGSKCGGGRHLNFLGCTTLAAHEGHHADCQNS